MIEIWGGSAAPVSFCLHGNLPVPCWQHLWPFSVQKWVVCVNSIWNFVVSPNMWLVEKVTFSYMIKWTNTLIQEINNSLGLSLFDHYLFVVYYMPDSITIDSRTPDNSTVYFMSVKIWINLLNPSVWNRHWSVHLTIFFLLIKVTSLTKRIFTFS